MTQLQRVFPDGKTVLIPTNGKPLPGYQEARAEIAAAGREVAPQPPMPHGYSGNLFAWLFGGDKSVDEVEEDSAQQAAANQAPAAQDDSQYNQAAVAQTNPVSSIRRRPKNPKTKNPKTKFHADGSGRRERAGRGASHRASSRSAASADGFPRFRLRTHAARSARALHHRSIAKA